MTVDLSVNQPAGSAALHLFMFGAKLFLKYFEDLCSLGALTAPRRLGGDGDKMTTALVHSATQDLARNNARASVGCGNIETLRRDYRGLFTKKVSVSLRISENTLDPAGLRVIDPAQNGDGEQVHSSRRTTDR